MRYGFPVGELQIFAHFIAIRGDIGRLVVFDSQVAGAVVGVVRSVVGPGFTFDTVVDDAADAVGGHHADLSQAGDVLIIRGIGEEGGEFLGQGGRGQL